MKKSSKWVDRKAGYVLTFPVVLIIVLFSVLPILFTLQYSFFDMQLNDRSRNDTYFRSHVNLQLNQETVDYLNFYLGFDEGYAQNEATLMKIDEIKQDLAEFEDYVADELATSDMRAIVQVNESKQNDFMAQQGHIVSQLEELYAMDDEFYSPEDTMAVAGEFETTIIEPNFSGLDNFGKVIQDRRVHSTLLFTVIFTAISVFLELVLGLALALIMNQPFKGRGIIRTFSLIPWAIPTAVAALIWSYLYNGSSGIVSHVFSYIGLIQSPASMLNSSGNALMGIIIADVWKTTPYMALLLLGGLQTIPNNLYESSSLEGASKWQQFRHITLPLLKPSIFVALLFRTLDAFRILDLIYVLTGGGPGGTTESISLYAYRVMFSQTRFGYGSAIVLIMALVVGIVTFVYAKALDVDILGQNV